MRTVGEQAVLSRRHRLQTAREWLLSGGGVLFFGPAGVGKSAAIDVITAPAVQSRCLVHRATKADAHRPYATLAGLLATVTDAELEEVPPARRRTLMAAVTGAAASTPVAAVRLAALNLVRVLARVRPLLLVIDDLQWVDETSAEVLRFIAPRVEDLPVQVAAAEQIAPDGLPQRRALCPPPLLVVRLDPVGPPTGDGERPDEERTEV